MVEFSTESGTTKEGRSVGEWQVVTNFLHFDCVVSGGLVSLLLYFLKSVEPLLTHRIDAGLVDKVVSRAREKKCKIEQAANDIAREAIMDAIDHTAVALTKEPRLLRKGTLIAFDAELVAHATQALDRDG
jgi:hypothetical protein